MRLLPYLEETVIMNCNRMGQEAFTWKVHKDGGVRIFWQGRCIMTLGGTRGRDLAAELSIASHEQAQYMLQRVTGNFKRGNERAGKQARLRRKRP
jgi:hypothetical protein